MATPTAVTSALATSLPHSVGPESSKKAASTAPAAKLAQRAPLRFRHPEANGDESSDSDEYSDDEGSTTAVDTASPEDNYVKRVLAKERPLPPITWKNWYREINLVSTLALTVTPALAIYGALTTEIQLKTFIWAVVYYFMTGLGITAGYHRLWSHRSYRASLPLQYLLAAWGSGAVQGSIKWWSRGHRAHHRYTDTDLDPYSAHKGLLWSHIGWMIVKPRRKPGVADVSDLSSNPVVKWQHRFYLPLLVGMGFLFPTAVAGLLWNDWRGGFFFAGAARLLFVHHSTFCVNSLAHWLGESPFDDKHTPRDHFVTALVTIGEGYHNFHHEFPSDYRNAIKALQYDPTKWFIFATYKLGLATQLNVFPDNEIKRGQFAMQTKKLEEQSRDIKWPMQSNDLPVLTWDEFREASETRQLLVIGGYIHDVADFIKEHPGGPGYIKSRLGRDATTAFYGQTYDHSNGAGNLLSMLRVGVISGGYEVEALKKYSEVIESLRESGGQGVGGKGSDIAKKGESARPMTVIKGNPELAGQPPRDLKYEPELHTTWRLTGGL